MRKENKATNYNNLFRAVVYLLLMIFFSRQVFYVFFSNKDVSWMLAHPYHLWLDFSAIVLLGFFGIWLLVLNNKLRLRTEALQYELFKRGLVEEALKDQRSLAQRYLDVAGVILIILNSKGVVVSINRKGCEILGYKEEGVLGKNWFDNFLSNSVRVEVKRAFENIMKGVIEPVEYFENSILTKDGQEKIIAWHNSVIKDKIGECFIISSGEDVTQRKHNEEQLRQTLCEKDILLKEVHHRVKNNLLILYGFITFQQKILDNEKGVKEALEVVKQRIQAI